MRTTYYLSLACTAGVLFLAGCSVSTHPSQVTWSGSVDDTATVYFQGGKAWVDNVTGKPVEDANATFHGDLPSSALTDVSLIKTAGRGQVALTQQPTKDNNYTAAVRIVDLDPGRDHYQFTLKW
jgi:hypothetical protein